MTSSILCNPNSRVKCMVCNGEMNSYFSKTFKDFQLGQVDYTKCPSCGFVAAKTLFEMNDRDWGKLNEDFHGSYHFTEECYFDANWTKRLKTQAETVTQLKKAGILSQDRPWLDWGCGDGKLSKLLAENDITLCNFDKFIGKHTTNVICEAELKKAAFDMVISTSVFEHVRNIEILEQMERLVSDKGCLAIHTLVREDIPQDPDWFYLLPVHCSLFTNKSMQILFDRWGYRFSIYHVPSRLWFWYRQKPENAENAIEELNRNSPGPEYYYKWGFMDYWK